MNAPAQIPADGLWSEAERSVGELARGVLLRCVDRAEPGDAKAMLLEMDERGLLSRRVARAEIQARGLQSA